MQTGYTPLRYEVRDEQGELIRRFATKQDAQHFAKLDPEFFVTMTSGAPKRITYVDRCTQLYNQLGPALI
jgi:hypothetical protein